MGSRSAPYRLDLDQLKRSWENLEHSYEGLHLAEAHYRNEMDFTPRRFDELDAPGRRLYIQSQGFLAVARDHQQAIQDMIGKAVRPFAVWSLIRPAFEASFYVVWALDPDEQNERKRRALRIAYAAERSRGLRDRAGKKAIGKEDDPSVRKRQAIGKKHEKMYEKEAHDLHMSSESMGRRINLTDELPKLQSLRSQQLDGDYFLFIWRSLSALEHGDMGAAVEVSDIEKRLKIPGGWQTRTTVNDEALMTCMNASMFMQVTAINLYNTRTMLK